MKRVLIFFLIIVFCLSMCGCGAASDASKIKHPYTQEYTPGRGNIKGDVDVKSFTKVDKRFAIGADADGKAVFKDPDAAYDALVEKYSDGITAIQKENHLKPFSKKNYEAYKDTGWQLEKGTKKVKEEADFVSSFVDIYENSFE
ncbi:MAG: hypothetical protein ACI4WY_05965 [Anaerovoracaceae bacterium]